jgi:hypothetical protein
MRQSLRLRSSGVQGVQKVNWACRRRWGEAPEPDKPPAYFLRVVTLAQYVKQYGRAGGWMRQTRCVCFCSFGLYWASCSIGAEIDPAPEEKALPVCGAPCPARPCLLQSLGGPTLEGRLCRRLVGFRSLALSGLGWRPLPASQARQRPTRASIKT